MLVNCGMTGDGRTLTKEDLVEESDITKGMPLKDIVWPFLSFTSLYVSLQAQMPWASKYWDLWN